MGRWETEEDRIVEGKVAAAYGEVRGFTHWEKYLPGQDATPDYLFYRGLVLADCAEIKRRHCEFSQYKNYLIDKMKVDALLSFSLTGVIVVAFNQIVACIRPGDKPPEGQFVLTLNEQRDAYDSDIAYGFRWKDFTIVCPRGDLY
jgi:hypothetical protein